PTLSYSADSGRIVAYCKTTGRRYIVDPKKKVVESGSAPKGLSSLLLLDDGREVRVRGDRVSLHANRKSDSSSILKLGTAGSVPAASRGLLALDTSLHGSSSSALPPNSYPDAAAKMFWTDMDADGDLDLVAFRYGKEKHTSFNVLVYRQVSAAESDSDADGLPNAEEVGIGTDPLNPDTDGDGLLDGWEVSDHRGLELKKLGCNPRKIDIICLISPFHNANADRVKTELERVSRTYSELPVENPDGSRGWNLHIIHQDTMSETDAKNPWWVNRDKFLPPQWRGMVHWMQITPGGGGQADQVGDGGSCGDASLWAVFLHEFGHQIGMDHDGFWGPGLCPIYRSLMNYAYSYSLEDDPNKIAYSTGTFKDYILNETRLDETIPLPYDEVKFLEKGPYRWRLKPNGATTFIDWNWNGVFGEKNIRADINYSYSTNAGPRDEVDKVHTAPWLFTHGKAAYALYGKHEKPANLKTDPSICIENEGKLLLRKLIKPTVWDKPVQLDDDLAGDPVAISHDGSMILAYARLDGIILRRVVPTRSGVRDERILGAAIPVSTTGPGKVLDEDAEKVPTVGQIGGRTFIFLWDPKTGAITYRSLRGPSLSEERRLYERSTIPPGMTVDTIKKQVLIGMAQDQDEKRPSRWQIRRFSESDGLLTEEAPMEWIEGPEGGARGIGRCRLLFQADRDSGPQGRIHFFAKGWHGKEHPWACTYVATSIADKSVKGGWLVKRYYDEWTQSRSAPAATWHAGDILWAYRWVDGAQTDRDNLLHVGYAALGIQDADMGDHDDLSFFRDFGIRHSILYLTGK
ncbi:MAG TPA: hypothetical protein VEX38_10395, partial [Fimbriimonadaceae bacterium]|nr:hypothetical protein [Fimbriimonadaceae bacterium]